MDNIDLEKSGDPREDHRQKVIGATAIVANLASLLADETLSSSRAVDIQTNKQALEEMDIDPSWYADDSIKPEDVEPWFTVVLKAERMIDEKDKEYGKYKSARESSRINATRWNFLNSVEMGKPISDSDNEDNIVLLRKVVKIFENRKKVSDIGGQL